MFWFYSRGFPEECDLNWNADVEGSAPSKPSSLSSNQCMQHTSPRFVLILFSLCGVPGMFCGDWGLSSPSGPCWPGFFCTAGIKCNAHKGQGEVKK